MEITMPGLYNRAFVISALSLLYLQKLGYNIVNCGKGGFKMEKYRILGKTGWKVYGMGFGGIPIQRVSYEEAEKIIAAAIDKGINFIDTARGYTDSESKIGKALKGKRSKVLLATKSMARTYQEMKNEIETSLNDLNTDYIDLYQCHNVGTSKAMEQILGPRGALEALFEAKEAGKIRELGITGHKAELVIKGMETGEFATVQIPYNFIERSPEKQVIPLAHKLNMGIIVMKPLGGGIFSKPELVLRFLLGQDVSVLIPGMDSIKQVEQNTELLENHQFLLPAELDYLQKEAREVGDHFCRRCEYCKPCPQGVDVTNTLLIQGYYERYNLKEWAKARYESLAVKADACIECGVCEERCPYSLPIREMLKKAHKVLLG